MKLMVKGHADGFALPTVLIASVVMLMVLLMGLTGASSSSAAIRQQYYDKLVSEATEAGLVRASNCLAASSQIVTWTNAKPLQPNTDCSGNILSGSPAPSAYVLDSTNIKTTFTVPAPIDNNGTLSINVTGTLLRYRKSGTGTPQTQSDTKSGLAGGQNSFSNIAFGYYSGTPGQGVHFSVVLPTGQVKTLGSNGNGRLGNGTTTNATTPTNFILPSGERGVAAYTNFLSVGRNIYVATLNGKVLGAGANDFGQLGNGTTSASAVSTPVQFNLPAGVKAKFVASLANATFVMGDNNNIYAAGDGSYGQLGVSASPAASYSTPQRVLLPTPNVADLNTLPETDPGWVQPTNLTADRLTMYVRMKGGAVYGWGANDIGQLGIGSLTNAMTPVKIGTFGDSGQPKAVQIGQDGVTLYVLDDQGSVWTAGYNGYGQTGGAATQMNLPNGYCMDVPGANFANSQQIAIYSCNRGVAQKYEWYPDGTIRIGGKCVDNRGNTNTNGNPIQLYDCNGGVAQQWTMTPTGGIRNPATGRCIDNSGNVAANANPLVLYDCNNGTAQQWNMGWGSYSLVKIPKPAGVNKFVRFSTDQYTIVLIDDTGKAWISGMSEYGQLGTGSMDVINPCLKQVVGIPVGRTIVDVYSTKVGATGAGSANTYFILDDGSVYGAGSNNYGQLGNGSMAASQATPVKMNLPAGVKAKSVQSGWQTTVVLTTAGKIYTVGNNDNGQLGDGTTTSSSTPKANAYTNQRSTILY